MDWSRVTVCEELKEGWGGGGGVKNTPVKALSEVSDSQRSLGFFQALSLLFSRLRIHCCLRQMNYTVI